LDPGSEGAFGSACAAVFLGGRPLRREGAGALGVSWTASSFVVSITSGAGSDGFTFTTTCCGAGSVARRRTTRLVFFTTPEDSGTEGCGESKSSGTCSKSDVIDNLQRIAYAR